MSSNNISPQVNPQILLENQERKSKGKRTEDFIQGRITRSKLLATYNEIMLVAGIHATFCDSTGTIYTPNELVMMNRSENRHPAIPLTSGCGLAIHLICDTYQGVRINANIRQRGNSLIDKMPSNISKSTKFAYEYLLQYDPIYMFMTDLHSKGFWVACYSFLQSPKELAREHWKLMESEGNRNKMVCGGIKTTQIGGDNIKNPLGLQSHLRFIIKEFEKRKVK